MYKWGDNKFIDFFSKVGGNEVKFGQAVIFFVVILKNGCFIKGGGCE